RQWGDLTSTNISVLVAGGYRPADVKARILERWGESMNLTVRLNKEFWAELRASYTSFYQLMDGLIWIAILVSGLAIANTMLASVMERRREVGILRAVGTRRAEVIRVVVGEAFGTGAIGGMIGVGAGLGLQWIMTASSEAINGASSQMAIAWGAIGLAIAVSLVMAPLVGFLPARWASRVDVVEALRYE
ncbi:MAG TPA: ABC transporter permease, partial [Symbiobacteriaceae bacterium]|nr:ABC transporter permease [Symbiobacteriaceae bacterium]